MPCSIAHLMLTSALTYVCFQIVIVWEFCYASVLGLTGLSTAGVSAPWYLAQQMSDSCDCILFYCVFICALMESVCVCVCGADLTT